MPTCLVVGASCRAIAESASDAGFVPCAVDLYGDRDLRTVAEVRRVTDIPSIGELPWDTLPKETLLFLAGGMENHLNLLHALESRFTLAGPTVAQIQSMRSLPFLHQLAREAGAYFPLTRIPSLSGVSYGVEQTSQGEREWLWKPLLSSGGIHVALEGSQHHELSSSMNSKSRTKPPRSKEQEYLQRRIEGDVLGVTFFADLHGMRPLLATQALKNADWWGPLPFIYRGSVTTTAIPPNIQTTLRQLGDNLFQRCPFRGWIGMDVIVDPSERIWLLEINPRWTASMELAELTGGFRWVSAWSDKPNAFEAPKEWPPRSEFVIGKGICYAPMDLEVSSHVSNTLFEHKWVRTPTIQGSPKVVLDLQTFRVQARTFPAAIR